MTALVDANRTRAAGFDIADFVTRSRAKQNLPPTVTGAEVLRRIASVLSTATRDNAHPKMGAANTNSPARAATSPTGGRYGRA